MKRIYFKPLLTTISAVIIGVAVGLITSSNTNSVLAESNSWINTPEGNMYSGVGGNVGIGTNTPQQKLGIYDPNSATLGLQSSNSNGYSRLTFSTNSRIFGLITEGSTGTTVPGKLGIYDYNAAQFRMVIDGGGNLGVGTTDPQQKLHIKDPSASTLEVQSYNPSGFSRVRLTSDVGKYGFVTEGSGGNTAKGALGLYDYNANQFRLLVDPSGNIGIGTTNLTSKLDINGGVAADYLRVDPQNSNGEGGQLELVGSGGNGNILIDNFNGNARIFGFTQGKNLEVLGASLYVNGTGNNYFRGNINIGAINPEHKLYISDPSAATLELQSSNNTGFSRMRFITDASKYGFVTEGSAGTSVPGKFGLYDYNANQFRMTVNQSGNVGIGTMSPTQKLEVQGHIKLSGDIVSDNNLNIKANQHDICIGNCQ